MHPVRSKFSVVTMFLTAICLVMQARSQERQPIDFHHEYQTRYIELWKQDQPQSKVNAIELLNRIHTTLRSLVDQYVVEHPDTLWMKVLPYFSGCGLLADPDADDLDTQVSKWILSKIESTDIPRLLKSLTEPIVSHGQVTTGLVLAMPMPELGHARVISRLCIARASVALERGDRDGYVQHISEALAVAAHISHGPNLGAHFVGLPLRANAFSSISRSKHRAPGYPSCCVGQCHFQVRMCAHLKGSPR